MDDIIGLPLPNNFDYPGAENIPAHFRQSLVNYFEHRLQPGRWMRYVLENNLTGAMLMGDEAAVLSLRYMVPWLHNTAPSEAWGSPEKVSAWLEEGYGNG